MIIIDEFSRNLKAMGSLHRDRWSPLSSYDRGSTALAIYITKDIDSLIISLIRVRRYSLSIKIIYVYSNNAPDERHQTRT